MNDFRNFLVHRPRGELHPDEVGERSWRFLPADLQAGCSARHLWP